MVLVSVLEFYVPQRSRVVLDFVGHVRASLCWLARRPLGRSAPPDLGVKLHAGFRKKIGEYVVAALPSRTKDHSDRYVGQSNARIELGNCGIVPFLDLAQIHISQYFARKPKLLNAR